MTADHVPQELFKYFQVHRRIAIAFSGGVDSSYLLYAAKACNIDVRAYTVENPFRSPVERRNSEAVCELLGVHPTVLEINTLDDPAITANPPERCYLCKKFVFSAIVRRAWRDGFKLIADATNATDDPDTRPGMKAVESMGICSPLRDVGLTKQEIRDLAREAGLPNWNAPSDSCLATRIATGTPITAEALRRTANVEEMLRRIGFSGIRARTESDGSCNLEVPPEQDALLEEKREAVESVLKSNYPSFRFSVRRAV